MFWLCLVFLGAKRALPYFLALFTLNTKKCSDRNKYCTNAHACTHAPEAHLWHRENARMKGAKLSEISLDIKLHRSTVMHRSIIVIIFIAMQPSRCMPMIATFLFGSIMVSNGETFITVSEWGSIGGRSIEKYTLKNKAGQEIDIATYGATIISIRTPDKQSNFADVVLGFDNVEDYTSSGNPYFGATIGRVTNRIKHAEFILSGKKYRLSKNIGEHSLHGGFKGWSSKIWNATIQNSQLVLSLLSEDGDEGYPGAAIASVTFQLTSDGELRIGMRVFVTKATPINLTNHSYFNLAGHNGNASELYKHRFTLNADHWTVTDTESIPTGEIRSVVNTVMDLRNSTTLGNVIDKVPGGGYDNNFCLAAYNSASERNLVATVFHPTSGRYLEVFSNQPGVQFYTANYLPERNSTGIRGKNGAMYFKHGGFCLETQNYPDAVNQETFPDSILVPGEVYCHTVTYKFGVKS